MGNNRSQSKRDSRKRIGKVRSTLAKLRGLLTAKWVLGIVKYFASRFLNYSRSPAHFSKRHTSSKSSLQRDLKFHTLSSMTSQRSSHQAGAGRGSKGDGHHCSSPAVTRSKKLFSNRPGMQQNQRGECLLSSASAGQPTEGATLALQTISGSLTSNVPQFQKLPQNFPNSGCPEANAREESFRLLAGILYDQRMNAEPKLSLVYATCREFLNKQDIEIANLKSECQSLRNAMLESQWENERLQEFFKHHVAAISVLKWENKALQQSCENQSAQHRRMMENAYENARNSIQEHPAGVLDEDFRQKSDEILSLKQTIEKLSSNLEELQKIAQEHELCVKSSTKQAGAHQQLNSFSGSYADKSATPGLLDSALCATKTAVTRFQKDLAGAIKDDLASVVDVLQPGAFFARTHHATYALRAAMYQVFFEGFENESFNTFCGVSKFVDPDLRQAKFHDYYLREQDQKEALAIEDPQFEEFCEVKHFELWKILFQSDLFNMNYLGELGGPQLDSSFAAAIRSVWLLHKLAFSFEPPASIFRVEAGADVDQNYMKPIVNLEDHRSFVPKVGFMITPGLRLRKTVLRCEVYLAGEANQQLES